jgi:PmbA protein
MEPFEGKIPDDLDWAETLVEETLLAGAVEAEVYAKTSATTGILLGEGFATLSGGSERGVALRVFDGRGNFGHACSSWADGERRRDLIHAALTALKEAGEAKGGDAFPAARPALALPVLEGVVDPRVTLWSPQEKREMVESALREASRGGGKGTGAAYRDGISRVALVNSRGFRAGYARTLSMVTLTRCGNGGPTLHAERVSAGPDPEGVAEFAVGRARLRPEGSDEEIEATDLLVESRAAGSLVRRLLPDLMENPGANPLEAGEEIRRLASEAVTMVDDGLLPGGVASAPFDGEGNPTGRQTLLKAGIRIDRLRSPRPGEPGRPGIAGRASYRDLPRPWGTNLFVAPGSRPLSRILDGMSEGHLLATLEGDLREGTPRPGRSRWRGLGWIVREGKCVGECRRLVFHAEPQELLKGVLEVSDRIQFSLRQGVALGAPDLLIRRR